MTIVFDGGYINKVSFDFNKSTEELLKELAVTDMESEDNGEM